MPKLTYRPNVCMLVFNKKFRLLLAERAGNKGIWQFPQGGREPQFTEKENVIRELKEELGIKKRFIGKMIKLKARHVYDFRSPPPYAIGKFRGQRQTFWLVEFLGKDQDIKLDQHEIELMDWRWCTPDQVRRLAEPHRLKGYRKPLKEFESWVNKVSK